MVQQLYGHISLLAGRGGSSYTFVAVTHSSLSGMASQIGVTINAITSAKTAYPLSLLKVSPFQLGIPSVCLLSRRITLLLIQQLSRRRYFYSWYHGFYIRASSYQPTDESSPGDD